MPMRRNLALALATLALLAAPTALAAHLHVSARATFATVAQGGFQDVDCLIENTGTEATLVLVSASVTYADGDVQTFRGLSQGPVLIEPDGAFLLSIGFAVPDDAAPGTATFTCEARAVGQGGMGETAAATAPFEVVPA